jgi:short-subunit dehydrogenase
MLKRQYGRIINIASIAGLQGNVNGPITRVTPQAKQD